MSTKTKSKTSKTKAKATATKAAAKPRGKQSPNTKQLLADAKQSIANNLKKLDAPKSKRAAKGTAQTTTEGNLTVVEIPPAEVITINPLSTATPMTKPTKSNTAATPKKLSAIDAAAKLLREVQAPLNCKQLIEGIAAKGYWTSPGGKTPHATLYSAILREIATKGTQARFTKVERGQFTANIQE